MKKYQRKTMANPQGTYFKKRIAKNRRRAKNVGLLYLLAIVAFAALACLPLCKNALASVGVMEFYKVFNKTNFDNWKNAEIFVKLATGGLYALMLLGVVINVFRALGKLRWLHKKTAHRQYGFNRNVYAMEDLGRIFSGSFAVILTTYFLISVLCGAFEPETLLYAVLGVGVLFRLFCGVWGAKVAYFDVHEGQISEDARKVGRFAPFFRNLLQLASVLGIVFFFVKATTLDVEIPALLSGGVSQLTDSTERLISVALQALVLLCSFVLIKHATAITEYNHEGTHGAGMKNFRVFSFSVALTAAGATAVPYLMDKANYELNTNMLIVAGVAFAMFLVELIMRKLPKQPEEKKKVKKEKPTDDSELHFESLTFSEPTPTEQPLSKKELKAQKKAQAKIDARQPVRPAPMVMPVAAPTSVPASPAAQQPMAMPQIRTCPQPQPYPYILPQPYPVYQPMPMPYQTSVNMVCPKPTPTPVAPAPAPVAPAPTPVVAPAPEEKAVVDTDNMQKVENGKAELNCPRCNARLRVDSSAEYHRCPACRKVFQLRKVQK